VAVDGLGSVYTTGSFDGTADFDPGAGTTNLTSLGGYDVFVLKLNSSGDLVWVKQFGGAFYDYSFSAAVDGSANVYTTGAFNGTADFDPGVGTTNLAPSGGVDGFVTKLDASGVITTPTTTTTVAPTTTPATTVPSRGLPGTGSSTREILTMSLVLLFVGLMLQKVCRRRTPW
jgi:hypothetical protein